MNTWGNKIRLSIFGESHGEAIGIVIDGLEAGTKLNLENINKTTQDILDKKFPKIPYNKNICGLCEFKNYCWGIQ